MYQVIRKQRVKKRLEADWKLGVKKQNCVRDNL